ncbi:hypothetical protein CSB66_3035 [Enterobacter hormaechei]|nr:hypothetical protein CSB66_3035 [Enterobacter hormaechei]
MVLRKKIDNHGWGLISVENSWINDALSHHNSFFSLMHY